MRGIGSTRQAAILDDAQIKRLLKIAGTTSYPQRDQTVVVLSFLVGVANEGVGEFKNWSVTD